MRAASLRDVERKASGAVAARARVLRRGEECANVIEQSRIGCEIGTGRTADRLLVDADQPLNRLHALHYSSDRLTRRGLLELIAFFGIAADLMAERSRDEI